MKEEALGKEVSMSLFKKVERKLRSKLSKKGGRKKNVKRFSMAIILSQSRMTLSIFSLKNVLLMHIEEGKICVWV